MSIYAVKKLSSVEEESNFTSQASQHVIVEDGGKIKRLTMEGLSKFIKTTDAKQYGVRKQHNSLDPHFERVGDSVGLIAGVSSDGDPARNDFDNIYPWSHMRRCDLANNGNVLAYEGDYNYSTTGYIWVLDSEYNDGGDIELDETGLTPFNTGNSAYYEGTCYNFVDMLSWHTVPAQVMVEIPKFYQKFETVDGYDYWWICETDAEGYRLSPLFDGTDKIYLSAYFAGLDEENITTSCSRKPSWVYNEAREYSATGRYAVGKQCWYDGAIYECTTAITSNESWTPSHWQLVYDDVDEAISGRGYYRMVTRMRGNGWELPNIAILSDILWPLFLIEFATYNSQNIMTGLTYESSLYCHSMAATEQKTVIFNNFNENTYNKIKVGRIASYNSWANPKSYLKVVSKNHTGSNTTFDVTFDKAVTVNSDTVFNFGQYVNGLADSVQYVSGTSGPSDESGAFKYRGLENIWGNLYWWIDGVHFCYGKAWATLNPSKYIDLFNDTWEDNYENYYDAAVPVTYGEDGSASGVQGFSNSPWIKVPYEDNENNGNFNIGTCDNYIQETTEEDEEPFVRTLYVGGSFTDGSKCGLFCCNGSSSNSYASSDLGSRLFFRKP